MKTRRIVRSLAALALGAVCTTAAATPVAIDTNNPQNGISEIYSATFDGGLAPCSTPGFPPYCTFFNGYPPLSPPAVRALVINPTPTGVINGVPDGITPAPLPGSFLDVTLDAGHQNVMLSGGVIKFPALTITISGSTFVTASGAGITFLLPTPQTTSIDANREAVFFVNVAPATAVDFSLFSVVAPPQNCTGPLCALIPILTLDMVRYRLAIDYDPTFTSFTATFTGQTANNSMVFATLNSTIPSNLVVTDSVPPIADQQVPFGNVPDGQAASQTVTVANEGLADLAVGQIALADPLAAPFTIVADNCSNQIVAPSGSCTLGIEFHPVGTLPASDSFDIPSDDPDSPTVTISVSGTGIPLLVPDITVTDSASPDDDLLVGFRNVDVSTTGQQTVTVRNAGVADLVIGTIGLANPLAAPFSVVTDNCSGQSIAPTASCTIALNFSPDAIQSYSDSFDIPSNDPDEGSVTVSVSGDGGVTEVAPSPEGANSGFMAVDPATLLVLGLGGVLGRRRRSGGFS